jgi:hypothetical protein
MDKIPSPRRLIRAVDLSVKTECPPGNPAVRAMSALKKEERRKEI